MTVVRVKGLKRYCVKGRWYAYHRKTGIRLKSEFGTGDFFTELAEIERKLKNEQTLAGNSWVCSSQLIVDHQSTRI